MNCNSQDQFTGFPYDPEGATETTDKETQKQYKRTIGVGDGSIWVSNEFPGARMNDFYQVSDSLYRIIVEPENHPINNSPWYAFKIWSNTPQTINLQLKYHHGKHRYTPKLSSDGENWKRIDSSDISKNTAKGTATLTLDLNRKPLWISAQELITKKDYQRWADSLATKPWVSLDTVGYSEDKHPLLKMKISQVAGNKDRGILIITGRQHPPEVTGALASKVFIDELTSENELASRFRNEFEVWAYPLVNPDGVQQGHWRHNDNGIDLNRDWKDFNQPETQLIRDDLYQLKDDDQRKVYYAIDFHSTNKNLFYPINREIETFPNNFTYGWIDSLKKQFPDYPIEVDPFDTSSPIIKNWIYHTFGADAVTYETDDGAPRDSIKAVTRESARIIMKQLLETRDDSLLVDSIAKD